MTSEPDTIPTDRQEVRTLLTGSGPEGGGPVGEARLWDVGTGKPLGPPLPHSREVHAVAFAPDGRRLATGCDDDRARVRELPPPEGGEAERVRLWVEVLTGLELDAGGAVRELGPDALRGRQEHLDRPGGPPPGAGPDAP